MKRALHSAISSKCAWNSTEVRLTRGEALTACSEIAIGRRVRGRRIIACIRAVVRRAQCGDGRPKGRRQSIILPTQLEGRRTGSKRRGQRRDKRLLLGT